MRYTRAEQLGTGYYNTPYKFNDFGVKSERALDERSARSAELDEETGLYYYGARYYDPRTSIFISVDPLANADKNIGYSPYSYAINNPITYIDPDGRCWQKVGEEYIPCDNAKVGSTTNDAFGYNWTMTKSDGWQLTNGADPSKVNYQYDHIAPTGDKNYYLNRYKNHIEKYNTRPPDYYLEYGYNNKALFDKTYPSMSDVGKEVFDKIGKGLQEAMNKGIQESVLNPNTRGLQGDNQAFKEFAYETHFPVYKESGIGKLGGDDLLRMISVPKLRDIFGSPEGRSLIKKLFPVLFSERPRNPDLWDPQKNPGLKRPGEF